MGFLDIVLGGILCFSLYKGIKNGLFIELASLVSLFIGIYFAIKFSVGIRVFMANYVSWSPRKIEIAAFFLTFILVIIGIHILAKIATGLVDFAYLGWINKLAGGVFRVLRTVLILGVLFHFFQIINFKNELVKAETLNQSVFYKPIQETTTFIYPKLEAWLLAFKSKNAINQ